MFYLDEEEKFVKKIKSYKTNVINSNKVILTHFLNQRQQELVKEILGKSVFYYFSNISEFDDYKRCVISPFSISPDFKIDILKLEYNKKFMKANHRMILGSIMNLQIERNRIGDILINHNDDIYVVLENSMTNFIKDNYTVIHHEPINLVTVDKVSGDFSKEYNEINCFVSSLRIDLICKEGFKMQRKLVQEEIEAGNLKINQIPITNYVKQIKENDIISLRGKGRLKILNVGGISKRNKIFVKIGKL